jgi:hypothetical protein
MSRSIFHFSSSPLQNALPNFKNVKKKRFRKLRKRSFAPKTWLVWGGKRPKKHNQHANDKRRNKTVAINETSKASRLLDQWVLSCNTGAFGKIQQQPRADEKIIYYVCTPQILPSQRQVLISPFFYDRMHALKTHTKGCVECINPK